MTMTDEAVKALLDRFENSASRDDANKLIEAVVLNFPRFARALLEARAEVQALRQNAEATNGVWQANLRLISERDTLAAEVVRLKEQVAGLVGATAEDGQRLLRREDVDGICDSPNLCFEYGATVRCGPCAVKAAERLGVEINLYTHSNPEAMKLRRECRNALNCVADLTGTLRYLRTQAKNGTLHPQVVIQNVDAALAQAQPAAEDGKL